MAGSYLGTAIRPMTVQFAAQMTADTVANASI